MAINVETRIESLVTGMSGIKCSKESSLVNAGVQLHEIIRIYDEIHRIYGVDLPSSMIRASGIYSISKRIEHMLKAKTNS